MSNNVTPFPSSGGSDDGGNVIDYRLGRLEGRVDGLQKDIKDMHKDVIALRETVARMDGRLDRTPTAMQIWPMIVTTWIAGAGIVALAVRMVTS